MGIGKPKLTILNNMAGSDFEAALDRHASWGIRTLDLKDCIYGKGVADLDKNLALQVRAEIRKRRMEVYCLSSVLFQEDVAIGEKAYRSAVLEPLARLLETAAILRPVLIRLLCAKCAAAEDGDRVAYVDKHAPWLWQLYRDAIDMIWSKRFDCTIENEIDNQIMDGPASTLAMLNKIRRLRKVGLTWDVQNMWQAGTFPSVEVFEALKPRLYYYHIKGGRNEIPGGPLKWRSSLADASWPVREITQRVIDLGLIQTICLNSPHGENPDGAFVDYTKADLDYLRANFGL